LSKSLKRNKDELLHQELLTNSILAYLAEHPHASDTLEGIAEWWVMRQQVRVGVKMLKKALSELKERGYVEKIGRGEKAQYHLKTEAIESHLKLRGGDDAIVPKTNVG